MTIAPRYKQTTVFKNFAIRCYKNKIVVCIEEGKNIVSFRKWQLRDLYPRFHQALNT